MNLIERLIRLSEAKRAIRKDRFREALDLLSRPPLAALPEAGALRKDACARLMARAQGALEGGDLAGAREALTIARQAGCDEPLGAELMVRLTRAEREQGMMSQSQVRDDALTAVRRDLAAGSLAGARDKLDAIAEDEHGEVDRMRRWLEARARDLDRYIERARRALGAEDGSGAREALERAEALFPSHPEVHAVRAEVDAWDRETLKTEITRAAGSETPEAVWPRYRDAIRRCPSLHDDPELTRVRSRLERSTLRAVRDAIASGKPTVAHEILRSMGEHADEEARSLHGGIQLWVRARERLVAGDAGSAAELLRAAMPRVGSIKTIKQELQAAEETLARRGRALTQIEGALETGDDQCAFECIDTAIGDGDPAPWLPALRREVASRLDAGAAALLEVRQMVGEGRIHEARLGLIPLLGQKQTHKASLALWKEITTREEAAARLLGSAEAVALDPAAGKTELTEARRTVDEAMHHRTDQAQAEEIRGRLVDRHAAWERYEEAARFADAGRHEPAIERCRAGLEFDPGHDGLQRLLRESARLHADDLLQRVEARLAGGDPGSAGRMLDGLRELAPLDPSLQPRINRLTAQCRSTEEPQPKSTATPAAPEPRPRAKNDISRFMIRVEEGPEALVLTDGAVHLGNARNPENHVALMANISSNHATIRREVSFHGGISYTLRAREGRECEVNGKPAREAILADGDEIRLGRDVALRFALPDPGSATALLEIVQGHHVDEIRRVLLMKGPGKDGRIRISGGDRAHLRPRRTDRTVWLYLEQAPGQPLPTLTVEADGQVDVDGASHDRRATVAIGSYVCCGPCRFQIGRVA